MGRVSEGSVEPPFDSKFHFNVEILDEFRTLFLNLLFNGSILLPRNVCKMAWWVANSVDPDQTPRCATSDLGLQCLFRPVCPNRKIKGNMIKSNPTPSEILLDRPQVFAQRKLKSACASTVLSVFILRMKKLCILVYLKWAQCGFWSDCENAGADMNIRWAQVSEGKFAGASTNLSLLGFFTDSEDVANATVFLLSDKASMINGSIMPVDGGILTHI